MDRYELAANGADKGLWDWDLANSRLHYSPGWITMLGCSENECGGTAEDWFKRIHPEDLDAVQREIASHLEQGATQFEMQHRMLHHDGCYRWMSCQGVITRNESGNPVRITGFHSDITADVAVDTITGLPNRRLLLNRLTRAIENSRKKDDFLFAVLIVDLDLFESGSNRLETANADALIIAAARRLESALRTKDGFSREGHSDLVARSGAEEFAILLEGLNPAGEAKRVADHLLKAILAPFPFNGRNVSLSASIGIVLSAKEYGNPEEVLRDADAALCRAKSLGKSRCEVFDTVALESAHRMKQLEDELHRALSRDEFLVFYQPIVSLSSNRVEGLEALLRWKHPSRGMVSPADFIPLAEKTGLIVPLGLWVIRQVCRQLKELQNNPRISKELWISVNLSAVQFTEPSLAKELREMLMESGVDANRLVLELTEGTAMEDPETARSLMMQLRTMGARIAIDDFGTGFSSLTHLQKFPLDYLKIDHSFVKSIVGKPDARDIIEAVCALAHRLGLRVIAEGIENSGQLDLLRSLGCEYGQGFLYSKPAGCEHLWPMLLEGFAFDQNGLPIEPQPATGSTDPATSQNPSPEESSCDQDIHRFRSLFAAIKRKWILAGSAIIFLLFLGIFLPKLNQGTATPGAQTSRPDPSSAGTAPAKTASAPGPEKSSSAVEPPQSPAVNSQPLNPVSSGNAYSYAVEHDHRLGSCLGQLTIGRDTISFDSEKGKDSFVFKSDQCSYTLDRNDLIIRSDSRTYRFKSATAQTGEENRADLAKIYRNLIRLHPPK